jgi:hypothetical protein
MFDGIQGVILKVYAKAEFRCAGQDAAFRKITSIAFIAKFGFSFTSLRGD